MASEKLQYVVTVDVFKNEIELTPEDLKLFNEAERARQEAYAPYSDFKVGAAVLLDNGKVISGNNQENAAYPSGLCAERVAVFYAMAQNKSAQIKTIAISCHSNGKDPVTPCGACRQAIAEYEQKQNVKIKMLMGSPGGKIYMVHGIEALLPFMFGGKQLKK